MNKGERIKVASATVLASGAAQVLGTAPSNHRHFINAWTMSTDADQNAILYEYGTGSVIMHRMNGSAEGKDVAMSLDSPFEIGSGSSVYLAVDGAANTSATVYYHEAFEG